MNQANKERKKMLATVLFIIIFTVLFIYLVNNFHVVGDFITGVLSLLLPFTLGCAIAFILNIPMRGIENALFKDETKKLYKYKRTISMLLAYLSAVLVIGLVIFVVVPEVKNTIVDIYDKLPGFAEDLKKTALKYTEKYPDIYAEIMSIEIDWEKVGSMFTSYGGNVINATYSIFTSVISIITNVSIGFVFSLYILADKEKLGRQFKMFLYAVCKEKTADEFVVFGKIANDTFSKFFTSQFREGIILGTMFMVTMWIVGMPYPLTIGVLIAFTALIPIFGAFFGLFIGCLLLLVEAPKMVIWFIITFFALQFIENNFIYPKLVGGDIGLSPIFVLLAVTVGGDLMGLVGMIVFIPLVSVFYSYFRSIVYRRLNAKNINVDDKNVNDDVVPLMQSRRRMFQRNVKANKADDGASNGTEDGTDENS